MFKKIISIALLFSCAAIAAGQPGRSRHEEGNAGGEGTRALRPQVLQGADIREIMTFKNELKLTDDQVAAIHQMRSDINTQAAKLSTDMEKPQQKLSKLLAQSTPDFTAIRAAYREIADITFKAQSITLDAYEAAYNSLTENQKNMLAAIRMRLSKERATKQPSLKDDVRGGPGGMPGNPEGSDVIDNGPGSMPTGGPR